MKIITKTQADKILTASLFNPVNGKTLNRSRFDSGKYRVGVSFIGSDVPDLAGVHAVYAVRQKDADGPYARLMCVCE